MLKKIEGCAYQLKKFTKFKGHEGEPLAQSDIYRGKKKVGEWSDDSWGGPPCIYFTEKAEEKAFIEHAKEWLHTCNDFDGIAIDVGTMTDPDILETAVLEMSIDYEKLNKSASHSPS